MPGTERLALVFATAVVAEQLHRWVWVFWRLVRDAPVES